MTAAPEFRTTTFLPVSNFPSSCRRRGSSRNVSHRNIDNRYDRPIVLLLIEVARFLTPLTCARLMVAAMGNRLHGEYLISLFTDAVTVGTYFPRARLIPLLRTARSVIETIYSYYVSCLLNP